MTITGSYRSPGVPVALSDAARRHPRVTRWLTAGHARVLHGTRGCLGGRWFGTRILLLETIGRRTGRRRSTALVYLPDAGELVVVAGNAGAERTPAWWLNLQAAGEGIATVGGERRPVRATTVEGARRERLWARFVAVSPVAHYQRQTRRRLPVVALTPLPVPAAPAPERELSCPGGVGR